MSKKFGKFLLLTAVAGVAAYGTYAYLQKKEQPATDSADDDTDDDFDDFSEDLDEDLNTVKERSYVPLNINLEKAEAMATEAFQKAKDVLSDSVQQVKETVKSVADAQGYHTTFTDVTSTAKDITEEEEKAESEAGITSDPDQETAENPDQENAQDAANETVEDIVEEFFDDEEPSSFSN